MYETKLKFYEKCLSVAFDRKRNGQSFVYGREILSLFSNILK